MGCVLTKVCSEEDMRVMQDCAAEDKGRAEPAVGSSRRLSRSKTGLLLVDPVTVALVADKGATLAGGKRPLTPEDVDAAALVVYGGGVPGVALDAERVELPEFTGARDGGYKSRSGRLRWGTRSRAGNDPLRRRKENQDCLCVVDGLTGDDGATLFSVFDGHGPQGAFVSHFVREQYHMALAQAYADLAQRRPAAAVTKRASVSFDTAAEMFKRVASAVSDRLAASNIDTSVSGTTAVGMLVRDGDVVIANIGDSRAIVARFCEVEQRFVAHCESADHKPDVPEERARIEGSNGRVFEWGSYRVWLQDVDMPGLGMSRSFGDAVAKTVGVTSDPDVFTVDALPWESSAKQNHPSAFAVLASDGIWEFFSTDECVEFVSACILQDEMSPQQACDALVEEAFERWNAEEDVVDDITVALVFF